MHQYRDDEAEDMERYLRKFGPRAIRPLKIPRRVSSPQLRWLAAFAMAVACSVALWYGTRQPTESAVTRTVSEVSPSYPRRPTPINALALTKLALDDSKSFDTALRDESQAMFPSMRGEQSALRVLAKE
jgi:hypothetical protein